MNTKRFLACCFSCLLPALCSQAADNSKTNEVRFDVYPRYFVGNGALPDQEQACLVFTNYAAFEKIFHPAAVMGRQKWIAPKDLDDRMIIAVVDTVNNTTEKLEFESMQTTGATLQVRFRLQKRNAPSTAQLRFCAVATVPKPAAIEEVVFRRADQEVKRVKLK